MERRCKFPQGLLVAYVDLKKTCDAVHREELWEILQIRGIPVGITDLMTALYSGADSAVKCGGGVSGFPLNA